MKHFFKTLFKENLAKCDLSHINKHIELSTFLEKYNLRYNRNTAQLEPYPLLNFEKNVFEHINNNKKSIILKSRQMHMTSMLAIFVAWKLINFERYDIIYISPNTHNSERFIKMVDYILEYYYEKIIFKRILLIEKNLIAKQKKTNTTRLVTSNRRFITKINKIKMPWNSNLNMASANHVDNVGRPFVNLVIVDECAYINGINNTFEFIIPRLRMSDSKMIISSSHRPGGNFFSCLWDGAVNRQNEFAPYKLNWSEKINS